MPFVVWKDEYSLGNELIDNQHKFLIEILNELAEAEPEEIKGTAYTCLSKMEQYAKRHFQDEEAFMREHGYPELEDHIEEHKGFASKIEEYKDILYNDYIPFQDMLEFLNNWLVEHMITSDQRYMKYIRQKDICLL